MSLSDEQQVPDGVDAVPRSNSLLAPLSDGHGMLITSLAALPDDALLDQARLAYILGKSTRTIRNMVSTFQLPPPVRFAGHSVWTVRSIIDHTNQRLHKAGTTALKASRRIKKEEI